MGKFKFDVGQKVLIRGGSEKEPPFTGLITDRSEELDRIVYDFDDRYGNPRWCYEEQILDSVIQRRVTGG